VENYNYESILTEGTFYKSDDDFTKAIDAVYYQLENGDDDLFGRSYFWESCVSGAGDMIHGTNRGTDHTRIDNFEMDGTETRLKTTNNRIGQLLALSNNVIYQLLRKGEANLSPVCKRILGEAYWIRGYVHFLSAYRMGRADNGVPFDRYEDFNPYVYRIPEQKATVMDNYALIIEDLEKAVALLPAACVLDYDQNNYGRATKAAAWAVMVKTYAYWAAHDKSKWEKVPALVDKIENEGRRALLPEYADVFTVEKGNWSAEEIFALNGNSKVPTTNYFTITFYAKTWNPSVNGCMQNGWGTYKPTLNVYKAFVEGDKRRKVAILEYGDEFELYGSTFKFTDPNDVESGFMCGKYIDPYRYPDHKYTNNNLDGRTDLNVPVIRFAEMLLFKAEALIEIGQPSQAAAPLNRIAERAGLGANRYSAPTILDVMRERRCELAFEYADRFGDLRRWVMSTYDQTARNAALAELREKKMIRKYEDRADVDSKFTEVNCAQDDGYRREQFNPDIHIAFPWNPDDIKTAGGQLKQNNGY
jgi:hypothetical protein